MTSMHVSGSRHAGDTVADPILIVAEQWAPELLGALASAVAGDKHWRTTAQAVLRSIANHELPNRQPIKEECCG